MPADGAIRAPLRVWCLLREQEAFVRPVEAALGEAARFVHDADWDAERLLRAAPDLVLCVNDWPSQVAACLDAARSAGIPSLVLQDGILEWRCQYDNPQFGAGGGAPQHQPVLADRLACIGAGSARHLEAWGNGGRVEITGMPRLDSLLERPVLPRRRPGSRLLVMTAKTPGFTPAQRDVTLRSLRELKAYLGTRPELEVRWRISRSLAAELGVENEFTQLGGLELAERIDGADVVVTTPSTAMLEAMLLDRPVVLLDYHAVPAFTPAAWTVSAPEQLPPTIDEALMPSAARLSFQRVCLSDALRCDGPAAPRVAALLERLAGRCGEVAPNPAVNQAPSGAAPTLAELYPDQPVFRETDVRALQVRLARLQHDNAALRGTLEQRSLGQHIARFGRAAAARLQRRRP